MEINGIDVLKKKIIEYKNERYFRSFPKIMVAAKKHLKVDYQEEGVFKKKYLIHRSDFGKKIFFDEIVICNFLLQLIEK
tara:strand:- start:128 stop:364 length:237 start_codon:yes stop_codon:yes gene_type:complete